MTTLNDIAADLRAEQEMLDVVLAGLSAEQWRQRTPSPGWTVSDQIGHLTYFDGAAAMAIEDPDAFRVSATELAGAKDEAVEALTLHRGLEPTQLLQAWRQNRRRLMERVSTLDDADRVVWYGPSMSAKSFLSARLMEVWAHGQDIVDTLGIVRSATDRLWHVAHMGYMTRGWSYVNRRLTPPESEVRLELTSPSGETWTWGPEDVTNRVVGPALDFCLVVTQRRHVDDTRLEVVGEGSRDWLQKAQVFAGPPTDGPASRET